MDDKNFLKESAMDWMTAIEATTASARDQDIYPLLQRWMDKNSPQSVLDLGCGQGICSSKLKLKNCRYVGVDPSSTLIDRAKELYGKNGHEFLLGNAYSLPFQSETFDALFSVALWHLLENSQEAAFEMARVLKSQGHAVIIMADPSQYSSWIESYEEKKLDGIRVEGKKTRSDGTVSTDVLYLRSKEQVIAELELAGLKISSIESFRNQIAIQCSLTGARQDVQIDSRP